MNIVAPAQVKISHDSIVISDEPDPSAIYSVALNDALMTETLRAEYEYPSNYIKTTKYSLLTFIPYNLAHQFRRFYNLYFLLAAALSFVPNAAAISPFTQVSPLVAVVLATMIKDGYEDYLRYRSDRAANGQVYYVVRDGRRQFTLSKLIQPGDVVLVLKEQQFPCDLVLLSSCFFDGACFIETSQLDGESNLKRKVAVGATAKHRTDSEISKVSGLLQCDLPNNKMNVFNGRLNVKSTGDASTFPLNLSNMLLRGAQLKNTDYVYGLCVYAGADTKIIQNLQSSRLKFSSLDRNLNKLLIGIFAYNLAILVISVILSYVWARQFNTPASPYLFIGSSVSKTTFLQFMTYYILYTYVIPISLFITMEFARIAQAKFIEWDREMTVVKSDGRVIPVDVRNSNLNEDLGNVEYIFSDKTGTLTQNVMKLAKWFSHGVQFDEDQHSGALGDYIKAGDPKDPKIAHLNMFARCIAVCHTAISNYDADTKKFKYEVESPDELALLDSIRNSEIIFADRGKQFVKVRAFGNDEIFEVLEVIEFSSDRRRMSIVVKFRDAIYMFCKGADQMLINLASKEMDQAELMEMQGKLNDFSCMGLRTLVFGYVKLSQSDYDHFAKVMHEAKGSISNREGNISDAAALIEKDLILLGCSAIDDKLQDEVPETIEFLLNSGIKLWVLTGDKRETAVNIAKSCRLITTKMEVYTLKASTAEELVKAMISINADIVKRNNDDFNALVVTGEALSILMPDYPFEFLQVAGRCHSVVCCRVSPLQKADVVRLVKRRLNKITLSVGDGANDVSMIQVADVGVGIVGMEGAQAVRASDYAIGEFRCLKRLVCVHGRYNKDRMRKVVYFCLYKNIAMITVCFWFGLHSGWSGLQVYQETFLSMFNVIFTSWPPLLMGIFEKDISEAKIYKYPQSFMRTSNFFAFSNSIYYIVLPFWHSLVIYWGVYFTFSQGILNSSGFDAGYWMMVCWTSAAIMIIVLAKLLIHQRTWTWPIFAGVGVSMAAYILFLFVCYWVGFDTDRGSAENIHYMPPYYLFLVLIPILSLLPDVVVKLYLSIFHPSDIDILAEMDEPTDTEVERAQV
eukprot:Partr_v1_DN28123_c1_g2_i2_m55366 putative phospholipidtransporting ATPase